MKTYTYPDLEIRKKAHEGFRARLGELQWAHKGSDGQVSREIHEFLKHWLTNHILKIDRKLSEFLKVKPMGSV